MSTLPFLLSVADELDNIHSQSYMDDFGLGFHPHRQYYRTPSIQLSLPASTDWMQDQRTQRCRTHKFVDETQNNLQEGLEDAEDVEADNNGGGGGGGGGDAEDNDYRSMDKYGASTSNKSRSRQQQQYKSTLNSNEDDNIDNSVQMYKLSKKCCKNYHRHGNDATKQPASERTSSSEGYRLHSKCMEANNSSSDESLQKVPSSSIEFLTCFLVKKSRAPKNASGENPKKS